MSNIELQNKKTWLKSSILRSLSPEEMDELARTVQSRNAPAYEFIFREEDSPKKFAREMRSRLLKDRRIIEQEADTVTWESRISWFDFALVIGVSVLLATTFYISNPIGIPFVPKRPDPVPVISASAAMEDYLQGQTLIVDAMPGKFFKQRHIKGAVNMPMDLFDITYLVSFSEEDKDKKIVVYGNTISRPYDLEIAHKLLLQGHKDVRVLDGGLRAWEARGYPIERKVSR